MNVSTEPWLHLLCARSAEGVSRDAGHSEGVQHVWRNDGTDVNWSVASSSNSYQVLPPGSVAPRGGPSGRRLVDRHWLGTEGEFGCIL